jgi:PAS domain S-box-containing protein
VTLTLPAAAGIEGLAALYGQSVAGICCLGPNGNIVAANASAQEMLQQTEAELRGRRPVSLARPADRPALVEIAEAGKGRRDVGFVRADGSCFVSDVVASGFVDQSGHNLTWLIFRDVTAHRRAEMSARALAEISVALLVGGDEAAVLELVAEWGRRLVDSESAWIVRRGDQEVSAAARAPSSERSGDKGFGPMLRVRLRGGERQFGELVIARRCGAPAFGTEELALADAFARQAGVALALAATTQELGELRRQGELLEERHDRQLEALEANDELIQTLCVAKWQLESGDVGGAAHLLTDVIEAAERLLAGLLRHPAESVEQARQRLLGGCSHA